MDSPQKFSSAKEVISFLAETFPSCFSVEGEAKPLKIGIFQDLAERLENEERVSKTLLRSSLRHYTNSWRYLHAVKEGAHRIDLDGKQDAVIEKEHADHAEQELQQSKQKVAERRKEQAAKKKPAKKSYKNKVPARSKSTTKDANVSATKSNSAVKQPAPAKLTDDQLKEGTQVTVKVGKAPMPATIKEVGKDGVQVQLNSGMVLKVQADHLRLAHTKR